LATVALAALSLCSCATTGENTYTGAAGDTEVVRERRNALLARKLSIANPRSRWEGSRLAVQFDLVNNRSETLDVEWTVDWFDRSGFVVAERSGWQPLRLAARSQIPMLITGPSPDAVTWKLHVRPSQPVR
jgi:uncharacterized protein YcfL